MEFKPREIANGFGNLLRDKMGLTNNEEKKLFAARRAVCDNCEHGQSERCGLCGCVIAAKTRSINSSCPIDLW